MKCRLHSNDLTSAVGVCASCLSERLFLIISAQSQQINQLQLSYDRRNSDPSPPPPPLAFTGSVSPYVCRRKFDGVSLDFTDPRFHSTPQISGDPVSESLRKKKGGKFSFITNLFKSRSDKSETDPHTASGSSSLWYPPHSKAKSVSKFVGQKIPIQNARVSDRRTSPECNDEEVDESYEPTWKQTPMSTSSSAAAQTRRRRHSNISGLAFCWSPLVRVSPNSLPTESRGGVNGARLSVANLFCKNRSKKMADFGRGGGFDHRR